MIRVATIEDLPQIVSIYNEAVTAGGATADLKPLSVEDRLEWFNSHDPLKYPIYVFAENDRVLGWCALSAYRFGREALRRTAEITCYVSFASHKKGIGSQLAEYTIEQAPKFGIKVLYSVLLETNVVSIALAKKHGFEQWAYLPDVAEFNAKLVSHVYYGRKLEPESV